MTLYYLPLEPYVERYTYLMSKPGGWAEDHFKRNKVDFVRIDGGETNGRIKTGSVVDAFARSKWAMNQVAKVLDLIEAGTITGDDVIYTEDFWHPGIESLFYVRDIIEVPFRVGCFMHAQSIDESDFTHSMKYWIEEIEKGYSKGYNYVFFTSAILMAAAKMTQWYPDHLHLTGLPFNKEMLLTEYGHLIKKEKEPFVLFSSRFDSEKNPHFFLDLVERCPDIQFKLVQPRAKLSNDRTAEHRAVEFSRDKPNFAIIDTSRDKKQYYDALGRASVQFNCAIQDWVSWTLIEAVTFRCKPLYPRWKDFPAELKDHPECIYDNKNLDEAEKKLRALLNQLYDESLIEIANKHDSSWDKKLKIMGLIK